ncbi:MAG: hypothetical protein JWP81_3354 [Ferruginibacter sp.]|nr:hypothetical protein [Ferruginibacter sp.]
MHSLIVREFLADTITSEELPSSDRYQEQLKELLNNAAGTITNL